VIGVTVCDEDRIEVFQANFQGLLSKVTGRIDNDGFAAMFDEHRNAKALVAWIIRGARLAIAGDRGNARRGAGAEESKFHEDLKTICHLSFVIGHWLIEKRTKASPAAFSNQRGCVLKLTNEKWPMTNGK
jgi:hypothetical protein